MTSAASTTSMGCLQSLDWTGGLTLEIIFMLSNEAYSPVELCGNPAALFVAEYMVLSK